VNTIISIGFLAFVNRAVGQEQFWDLRRVINVRFVIVRKLRYFRYPQMKDTNTMEIFAITANSS